MSLVQGTDYLADTSDAREIAGSVIPANWPNSEIQEEQASAYTDVKILTHKYDWSDADPEIMSIKKAELQLTRAYILEHRGGMKYFELIKSIRDEVYGKLAAIKDNMQTVTPDEGNTVGRTEFKSWNKNPALPFESKLNRGLRNTSLSENELD